MNKLLGRHVGIISNVEGELERASGLVDLNVEHIVVLFALVQLLTGCGLQIQRMLTVSWKNYGNPLPMVFFIVAK